MPGIGTNSLGSKFPTGTNCLGNFGCPELLAAGPSSLIHRYPARKFMLQKLDDCGFEHNHIKQVIILFNLYVFSL